MYPNNDYRNYLMHHGILGQRWGVRRYQNENGSLTSRGKDRYSKGKKIAKRVAIGLGITAGIAAVVGIGVAAANSNPGVIKDIKNQLKDVSESKIKNVSHSHKLPLKAKTINKRLSISELSKISMDYDIQRAHFLKTISMDPLKANHYQMMNKPLSELSNKSSTVKKGEYLYRIATLKDTKIGGGSKSGKMFIEELSRRGYNAMSDDMDNGFMSRSAAIIFNPKNNVKLERVKALTQLERYKNAMRMKAW